MPYLPWYAAQDDGRAWPEDDESWPAAHQQTPRTETEKAAASFGVWLLISVVLDGNCHCVGLFLSQQCLLKRRNMRGLAAGLLEHQKSIDIHRPYVAPPCLHAYQFLVPVLALDRPRFITRRFNGLMAQWAGKEDRIWRRARSLLQPFATHCSNNGRSGMNRPWCPSRLWWKLKKLIQILKCI